MESFDETFPKVSCRSSEAVKRDRLKRLFDLCPSKAKNPGKRHEANIVILVALFPLPNAVWEICWLSAFEGSNPSSCTPCWPQVSSYWTGFCPIAHEPLNCPKKRKYVGQFDGSMLLFQHVRNPEMSLVPEMKRYGCIRVV